MAQSIDLDCCFGIDEELPLTSGASENPCVFDTSAPELKEMAAMGLVEIVLERAVHRDAWS